MKQAIFISILVVVVVFAIFQSFQISALARTFSTNEGQKNTGESNEQMMARMHPDQAGTAPQTRYSGSQSPQMVGGC
jgi:hypothetical protein